METCERFGKLADKVGPSQIGVCPGKDIWIRLEKQYEPENTLITNTVPLLTNTSPTSSVAGILMGTCEIRMGQLYPQNCGPQVKQVFEQMEERQPTKGLLQLGQLQWPQDCTK